MSLKPGTKDGAEMLRRNGVQPVGAPVVRCMRLTAIGNADVLAGRKTVGERTGEIRFGGVPPTRQFLRRYTGYVEQFGAPLARCVLA
jgi:hypothetical protein